MRQHLYESQSDLLGALTAKEGQTDPETKKRIDDWMRKSERYAKKAAEIKGKAEEEQKEAAKYQDQSVHTHHRTDRFDWGELGIELALVLCSVAILAKQAGYWYSGMGVGLIGLAVVLSGLFVH